MLSRTPRIDERTQRALLENLYIMQRTRRGQGGRLIPQKSNWIVPNRLIKLGKFGGSRLLLVATGAAQHLEQFVELLEQRLALLGGQRLQQAAQGFFLSLEQFAQQGLKHSSLRRSWRLLRRKAQRQQMLAGAAPQFVLLDPGAGTAAFPQ